MLVKSVKPEKILLFILVALSVMVMLVRFGNMTERDFTLAMLFPIVRVVNFEQFSKAESLMVVTLSGITMLVNREQ